MLHKWKDGLSRLTTYEPTLTIEPFLSLCDPEHLPQAEGLATGFLINILFTPFFLYGKLVFLMSIIFEVSFNKLFLIKPLVKITYRHYIILAAK